MLKKIFRKVTAKIRVTAQQAEDGTLESCAFYIFMMTKDTLSRPSL